MKNCPACTNATVIAASCGYLAKPPILVGTRHSNKISFHAVVLLVVDAQNEDGDTVLYWTVRTGRRGMDLVQVLTENGCRPPARILNKYFKLAIDVCADGFHLAATVAAAFKPRELVHLSSNGTVLRRNAGLRKTMQEIPLKFANSLLNHYGVHIN